MDVDAPLSHNASESYPDDDARWRAVQKRDASADGQFFCAVCTTGVFCRPTCPARQALRKNIRFFLSASDAERAGFRRCKRCKPGQPTIATQHAMKIAKACRLIEGAEEMPNLDDLARAVGLSRYHFHRIFKATVGLTPKVYASAHRLKRVREELGRATTVTRAIYGAGFNSNGRFYAKSTELLGMTPTEFRSGGLNITIRFAVGECSLGSILIAATSKGICAILLDDDPNVLVQDLQDRFPSASLVGGDAGFEQFVARVVGFVERPALGLDLPLDVRGTAFQQRVWQVLRDIPIGATMSYSEVAKRLGLPKAARAVAQACGANNIAVAVPCHRVIRSDGSLSGYRWGIERKRTLLDRESAK